jgi:hypothetical protein
MEGSNRHQNHCRNAQPMSHAGHSRADRTASSCPQFARTGDWSGNRRVQENPRSILCRVGKGALCAVPTIRLRKDGGHGIEYARSRVSLALPTLRNCEHRAQGFLRSALVGRIAIRRYGSPRKAASDSDGRRPSIPIESGHPIRTKAAPPVDRVRQGLLSAI